MRIDLSSLRQAVEAEADAAIEFLREIVMIPSVSGDERAAMERIAERFAPLLDELERVPFATNFVSDAEYSSPVEGLDYSERCNLRGVFKGAGTAGALIFNSHADVVPPSKGQAEPYSGKLSAGAVHGRGACDAKGQIATLYLLLRALRRLNLRPAMPLIFHLVVEEEIGGNGTLGMMRRGEHGAAGAVILEPTACRVVTSVRGAVWFRLQFRGVAGHSGSAGSTISALKLAIEAIGLLERYQQALLAESRTIALFSDFANPMPITFGKLNAGNWPAAAPDQATLEGVLGFLPNKQREQIIAEMEAVLREQGSEALRQNFTMTLMYRHNAHVTEPAAPLAAGLLQACARGGLDSTPTAFPASCDSWFYPQMLGIPAIVFGPGELRHAHAADEQLATQQLTQAASTLLDFVLNQD